MNASPLVTRFESDLEHLVWRSGVYGFSSTEVLQHFIAMRDAYQMLVSDSDRVKLAQAIKQGFDVIRQLAYRHQHFDHSGMTPRAEVAAKPLGT